MSLTHPLSKLRTPHLVSAFLAGILLTMLLPSGVAVMNDDFGYLRSVVETIQRNRPWTNDWLEPRAISLSVATALLYRVSGSFTFGVLGLQVFGIMASAALCCSLCRDRRLGEVASVAVSLLIVTFPTLLWKEIEFTGMVLYGPCLIAAIWAAEKGRWIVFWLVWVLAMASRQSALIWGAIPAWVLLQNYLKNWNFSGDARKLILILTAGVGSFACFEMGMNSTHSQLMVTSRVWERMGVETALVHGLSGIMVFVLSVGLGTLAMVWKNGGSFQPLRRGKEGLLVGVTMVALIFAAYKWSTIMTEHSLFDDSKGKLFVAVLTFAGALGWVFSRIKLRHEFLFAGVAGVALLAIRTEVYDYYFIDLAMLGFFAVRPSTESIVSGRTKKEWGRVLGGVVFGTALWFQGISLRNLKSTVDHNYATCVLNEMALRDGRLDVTELSNSPFGFMGWKLHPYFIAHDGKNDPSIGGFMRYLRWGTTDVRESDWRFWSDSKTLHRIDADPRLMLSSGVFRDGPWGYRRFTLLKLERSTEAPLLPLNRELYQQELFPLNDDEWDELIDANRL